ncbi:DNA-directed RNA polymerase III subunit RPC3 isoform X2 [Rosa chinensis]|uniref:DNA-directed RNA polymerase III subunit RPC3 isoform X2 n=1 Tax=Rosa chinensis TaxID=74649 RepID=UPI001AD8D1A7|nr:DNA-directed RNA polymerase III subunit RPC3 isoform X2 [Rosa chinensis]
MLVTITRPGLVRLGLCKLPPFISRVSLTEASNQKKKKKKMTVTNSGIQYAVQIITKHFGNLVAKVCETLLKSGPLNLGALIRSTALTPQQVKNSLLILVQHNCVQPFTQESKAGLKVQYMAVYDNILHRLRFAKFLAVVAQELDDDCKQLLAGLLEHGRLTQQQLMDRANQKSKSNSSQVQNAAQDNFIRLVTARFVERCPAPEPLLEEAPEQEGPKKPRSKSAKMAQVSETIEQRVLAAARPMEAIRFLITTNPETDDPSQKSENNSSSMSVGEKRKFDDLDIGEHGSNDKEVILWRANFEQFIRCLRHKACVENVRARHDDGAAVVLRAVLKATRMQETKVKTDYSVPLKMGAIYNEVIDSAAGRNLTKVSVKASLHLLCGAPPVRGGYEDLKKIIELLQNDEVESIVLKRYGQDACRIFRLLTSQSKPAGQFFETDKISVDALVDKKETPKILYKLWKDDYVHMEKLSLTTAKQSQVMVWKVHKSIVWEHVLDEMYHAAYNLVKRYDHEREENKEVTNTPKEKRVGELEKKANRFLGVRKIMALSLVKLDDALMLFHDF